MTFIINSKKFGNYTVLIDRKDYTKIKHYSWSTANAYRNGRHVVTGLKTTIKENGKRKTVLLHRLILNVSDIIDHVNNNPLDNRRKNLRVCSYAENARNRKNQKNQNGNLKGVKRKILKSGHVRYVARIIIDGVEKHAGVFETPQQAALAYNEAAKKYHSQFAALNVVR